MNYNLNFIKFKFEQLKFIKEGVIMKYFIIKYIFSFYLIINN